MAEPTLICRIGGLDLVEHRDMVGAKFAARVGRRVYVSPAMMDLVLHAEGDELWRLLDRIPMRTFPELLNLFELSGVSPCPE